MQQALANVGVFASPSEARLLARTESASEFERALADLGLVASRSEAHLVLQKLKRRARGARDFTAAVPVTLAGRAPCEHATTTKSV